MSDLGALRRSLQEKLAHRRRLLTENATLRTEKRIAQSEASRARAERDFALEAMKSPLVDALMEDMADEIANAVISEALRASRSVAEETFEDGSYEIGITIPSLHIRRRLHRMELSQIRDEVAVPGRMPIRRVSV